MPRRSRKTSRVGRRRRAYTRRAKIASRRYKKKHRSRRPRRTKRSKRRSSRMKQAGGARARARESAESMCMCGQKYTGSGRCQNDITNKALREANIQNFLGSGDDTCNTPAGWDELLQRNAGNFCNIPRKCFDNYCAFRLAKLQGVNAGQAYRGKPTI